MNPPRCNDEDYIQFLLATPKVCSALEAARVGPPGPAAPAHDAFTRLLHRLEPDAEALWREVGPLVARDGGVLVVDDSVLDKPHSHHIEAVSHQWSGRHGGVARGIGLVTLVWTDGDRIYPVDYRIYHKEADGKTKNDHLRDMLAEAKRRGFAPRCVLFDRWYSGLENLLAVRDLGWRFLAPTPGNRRLSLERSKSARADALAIDRAGTPAWLPGFGPVRAFRIVARDGGAEHWITGDPAMTELERQELDALSWSIEEYHRGLKQHCGVERCQARAGRAQRTHVGLAIRAFVRLEWHRWDTGVSWFEAKTSIVRDAVRRYLAAPWYRLPDAPTA
ncbi:IS701 family transposase [Paludisphaera soli]|uniref:IS701 family transposase n=1 Tax=Paludisphaera soli TaxID=2712865 RepID=UPI0013EE287E|nr:transposase [Paludisphaera soli]